MARLVNIRDLVPQDIEVQVGDTRYSIPGDLDGATVFEMLALWQEGLDAEREQETGRIRDTALAFERFVFGLLKLRQPELEASPVGLVGARVIAQTVLVELGLVVLADQADLDGMEDPTKGKPATSPRSTGSRNSPRKPASPRARGGASRSSS